MSALPRLASVRVLKWSLLVFRAHVSRQQMVLRALHAVFDQTLADRLHTDACPTPCQTTQTFRQVEAATAAPQAHRGAQWRGFRAAERAAGRAAAHAVRDPDYPHHGQGVLCPYMGDLALNMTT